MVRMIFLLLVLTYLQICSRAQTCDPKKRTKCVTDTQAECLDKGCCWSDDGNGPSCFFQTPKYIVKSSTNSTHGVKLILEADNVGAPGPAAPITPLVVELSRESVGRLHIKITDPNKLRWEIPSDILPVPPLPAKPVNYPNYDYQLPKVGEEFTFSVFRSYYNDSIFNTSSIGLFFSDQYLKIGTTLAPNYNIYGLGEHKTQLRLQPGKTYTLWNYDTATPEDLNLYGSHPFYLEVRGNEAHGVFLRNSNGMDVVLGDTSLTYNVIGGVLDFYFFVGYEPDDVVQLYHEVIGRPAMPPYWALGFHQCRWGYKSLQEVKDVVTGFKDNDIPLDVVWTDIDYMDKYKDFSTDATNFPAAEMKSFINELHQKDQHFVVIIDPAISTAKGYKPFQDGIDKCVFISDAGNKLLLGKVWPGETAFPDFTHPNAMEYWSSEVAAFLTEVPVDGLWIDMNEPSNFCDGSCDGPNTIPYPCPPPNTTAKFNEAARISTISPPYSINNQGSELSLNSKTVATNANQFLSLHYNLHNLYGLTEAIATNKALKAHYKGKRPFVLSRSTFAGSGVHTAHWLGDNTASADDLYYSIPGMLNFQMFGVPLVGADICGFGGSTTEELCGRWMQLGALYPFSRNHNTEGAPSQEPYRWSSVAAISRTALSLRYSLFPFYYTLFLLANTDPNDYLFDPSSSVVMKPLFFDFSSDPTSLSIDTQFLIGSALLISPQLKLGDEGKTLELYLPPTRWYDWYTLDEVTDNGQISITVETPLNHIPIHIRGGYIVPMQTPGKSLTETRMNPYSLLVALNGGYASGSIYIDDGETFNTTEYTFVSYSCGSGEISAFVSGTKYATKMKMPTLQNVTVTGLSSKPSVVALDGQPMHFHFTEGKTFKLVIYDLSINMDTEFHLGWI